MQRKGEKEGTEVYKNGGIRSDVRAMNISRMEIHAFIPNYSHCIYCANHPKMSPRRAKQHRRRRNWRSRRRRIYFAVPEKRCPQRNPNVNMNVLSIFRAADKATGPQNYSFVWHVPFVLMECCQGIRHHQLLLRCSLCHCIEKGKTL